MIGDFRRNSHRRYPNLKITVTAPSYNYTAIWWFVRFFRRSKADHRICKQTDNIRRSRSAYSNLLMTLPRRISDYLLNHCKIRVLFYYFAEKNTCGNNINKNIMLNFVFSWKITFIFRLVSLQIKFKKILYNTFGSAFLHIYPRKGLNVQRNLEDEAVRRVFCIDR